MLISFMFCLYQLMSELLNRRRHSIIANPLQHPLDEEIKSLHDYEVRCLWFDSYNFCLCKCIFPIKFPAKYII